MVIEMNKNRLVGLILVIVSLLIFSLFLLWIIILPAIGITEQVSTNITSGYWGIAIFTMLEVVIITIMLFWVGKTPLTAKEQNNES